MAAKKGKNPKVPSRAPAEKLLLDFIQANKIVLLVDEVSVINTDIPDAIYVTLRRPRVRALYLDEVKKKGKATNGEGKPPPVDIVK